jgi:hypothetical protein
MKKILLILTLTLVFSQKVQSQSQQEQSIGSILVEGLFTSKKEKKKIDRQNFVIDSTNNAIETSKKREIFVRDSIAKNRLVEEKKKSQLEYISWIYSCNKCKFKQYKVNPKSTIAIKKIISEKGGSFGVERRQDEKYNYIDSDEKYKSNIEEAKLRTLSVEIYADTTATNKIGVINLAELPLDEVFVEVAYKRIENENITIYANTYSVNENHLVMLKSVKTNKAYVIRNYVYNFYDEVSESGFFKEYTDPLIIVKEKTAVTNFKIKLKSAISTVNKMIVIQNKHLFQERNMFGQVINQYYDSSKFTKVERATYNQLFTKLVAQNKVIQEEQYQKIGRRTFQGLLSDLPIGDTSFGDIMTIDHASRDFKIY